MRQQTFDIGGWSFIVIVFSLFNLVFQAEAETDEVYAQIILVPEKDVRLLFKGCFYLNCVIWCNK